MFYVGQKDDRVVASQFPEAMNQRDPQNSVVSSPRMETTAFEGTFQPCDPLSDKASFWNFSSLVMG